MASNLDWLDLMPDAPEFGYVNLEKRAHALRVDKSTDGPFTQDKDIEQWEVDGGGNAWGDTEG